MSIKPTEEAISKDKRIRFTIWGGIANENTRAEDLGGYLDPEYEALVADLKCKPGDPIVTLPWDND